MRPLVVAALLALLRWGRIAQIALQPILNDVVIELLGPQHAGEALPHHVLSVCCQVSRNYRRVELVGFTLAKSKRLVKTGEGVLACEISVCQAETYNYRLSGWHFELVVGCRFCALVVGIHSLSNAMDDEFVDSIFHIRSAILCTKKAADVGLILSEEKFRGTL